jgi:hypothetical protein
MVKFALCIVFFSSNMDPYWKAPVQKIKEQEVITEEEFFADEKQFIEKAKRVRDDSVYFFLNEGNA